MHTPRRLSFVLSILLLAGLLMSCVPPAVPPAATVAPAPPPTATSIPPTPAPMVASTLDPALSAEIEALVTKAMRDYKLPGLAIGVIKDGEVAYTGGFGVGNVETDAPITPQSLFVMASVSKMFTAAAIMQLVEKGLIDLNAPVIDFLPYFQVDDPLSDQITVLDLLAHTSGLPFQSVETEFAWQRYDYDSPDNEAGGLERFVKSMTDVKLLADPGGSQTLYSSIAFDVLGDIVAKVSGQEFEAYMQEYIFDPLGMDHSTFMLNEAHAELLTIGHRNLPPDPTVKPWPFFPFNREHAAAAGLITNVDDMSKWAMALLNGGELNGNRILAAESLHQIWSPASTYGAGGLLQDYGLGWFMGEDQGHSFVWHPGGIPGYTSNLILAPADGVAVVTMSNFNRNTGEPEPWYATEVGHATIFKVLASMPKPSAAAEPPPDALREANSLDPALVAEIESIVEAAMTASTVPGMGVAVVQDGEIVFAQGFGVTDIDTGEPVTADTPFLWAENTFPLATVAAMQLADQGLLDLDAPITDYLPYFELADDRYVDMTVRHILQHRSGLGESGNFMAEWTTFQPETDDGSLERAVREMADNTLIFAPGEQQEWSDISFIVLGDVIAKASGQSFEAYMQDQVLSPLSMANSSFLLDDVAGQLASPHVMQSGKQIVAEHFPYHRPFGAVNNLMASAEDMARFAQAMTNRGQMDGDAIVSEDAFLQMWGDSKPTAFGSFPFGVNYPTKVMAEWGAGWFVSDDAGTPTYASFGQEYGFHGQMVVAPEAGLAVVAIGNAEITGAYYASDVAVDVLRMLLAASSE